jgi:hypothetical protein
VEEAKAVQEIVMDKGVSEEDIAKVIASLNQMLGSVFSYERVGDKIMVKLNIPSVGVSQLSTPIVLRNNDADPDLV